MHLVDRQDVGQRLVSRHAQLQQRGPVPDHGPRVEKLDTAVRDLERARGELTIVLQVQEVIADLGLAEPVRGLAVVGGQLPHGADVGLLRALAETGELQILNHALTKRRAVSGGHRETLSQRSEEEDTSANDDDRRHAAPPPPTSDASMTAAPKRDERGTPGLH